MLCFLLLVYHLSYVTCSELLSRQRRAWIIDTFSIEEENPGPFPYELGKINVDRIYRIHFDLFGEGADEEPKGVLSIHKETGMLIVHKAVDYEKNTMLRLRFEARNSDMSIYTKLGLEITIKDINDNPPRFQRDLYEIKVAEDESQGSHLLTVLAYDRDMRGTPNSTFHYEIKSVFPNHPDTEFFVNESGAISFKGCLDHEVAEMFTVLVEAKDHGEAVRLSSSTTVVIHVQDGNNHLPVISGQTGSGKVKERESGTSPLRLHVTDKDSKNSSAWRAKYSIQGDEGEYFRIDTNPETNDGILTVVKPLDFEEAAQRQLSITVENEIPYFSCKVKDRTTSGLWKVDTSTSDGPVAGQPHTINVLIEVEDTNDPPVFNMTVKEAMLEENVPTGTWVEKVTAVDPDSSHARDFVYKIGSDPAGWLKVDPHTGDITTVRTPDRESPHVVNGLYTVILYAVDNGNPPKTGTATLNIHVTDQNDNVPRPTVDVMEFCISDRPTTKNITASDLDGTPFGAPFSFELLGDFEGKWTLNPSYGNSAGLWKEPSVYAGQHTINLKISDIQGEFGVYNLRVTVCDCSVTTDCQSRRGTATRAASGAIGIVFATLFLLSCLLLAAVVISCEKEFTTLHTGDSSGETLLASNIEKPGTDCKIPEKVTALPAKNQNPSNLLSQYDGIQKGASEKDLKQSLIYKQSGVNRKENGSYLYSENWNQANWNSMTANDYRNIQQIEDLSKGNFLYTMNSGYASDAPFRTLLNERLSALHLTEKGVVEYQPHLYADEEDLDTLSELENITVPDDDSFQKVLNELGPEFRQLAAICKPPHIQN